MTLSLGNGGKDRSGHGWLHCNELSRREAAWCLLDPLWAQLRLLHNFPEDRKSKTEHFSQISGDYPSGETASFLLGMCHVSWLAPWCQTPAWEWVIFPDVSSHPAVQHPPATAASINVNIMALFQVTSLQIYSHHSQDLGIGGFREHEVRALESGK